MKKNPFYIIKPTAKKTPFVLSIPHRGTDFPDELKNHYVPELVEVLDALREGNLNACFHVFIYDDGVPPK